MKKYGYSCLGVFWTLFFWGIGLLLSFGLPVLAIWFCYDAYRDRRDPLQKEVGQSVVYGNDTLTVVDYTTFEETLTFDNGRKVSYEFYNTLKKK